MINVTFLARQTLEEKVICFSTSMLFMFLDCGKELAAITAFDVVYF